MTTPYVATRLDGSILATGTADEVASAIAREPPCRAGAENRPSRFRVYRGDHYISYAITTLEGIAWSGDDCEWGNAVRNAVRSTP